MKLLAILLMGLINSSFIDTANKNDHIQSWLYVGKSAEGDTYYIKKHSTGSNKVWVKTLSKITVYFKSNKKYTTPNGSKVTLFNIDCVDRRMDLRSYTIYNANGTIIETYNKQDYDEDWTEVVPDSVGEMFLDKACELE